MGYTNVRDYSGGKQDWIDAGLPVEGTGRSAPNQ
jgi:rhodanese-related sulfurtransferase